MSVTIENPANVSSSGRYLPTPSTSSTFEDAARFVQNLLGVSVSSVGAAVSGVDPSMQNLINAQLEVQKQMMLTSMISNVHKSRHETEMAPVRNIRVG
jgi:hypothetical protein